jgi:hypothetical protein
MKMNKMNKMGPQNEIHAMVTIVYKGFVNDTFSVRPAPRTSPQLKQNSITTIHQNIKQTKKHNINNNQKQFHTLTHKPQ